MRVPVTAVCLYDNADGIDGISNRHALLDLSLPFVPPAPSCFRYTSIINDSTYT